MGKKNVMMSTAPRAGVLLLVACVLSTPISELDQWEEEIVALQTAKTAFPWKVKCVAGTTSSAAPNIFVSPSGADAKPAQACKDTIDDCKAAYVPSKCSKSFWKRACPVRCQVCDPTAAAGATPGSRAAPYKTLQYAV